MESVRTCMVCRKKGPKSDFCRFVRALDGEICFDEKGELPHRGAWLCASKTCLLKAFKKRILFKGERTLPVQGEGMVEQVYARIKKSSLARLGFLRKLGQIEAGRDAVRRFVHEGKASVVIFAKDFSARSQEDMLKNLEAKSEDFVRTSPFLMDEIGQCLGRKKTGVVGLSKSRITDEILLQLKKLSNLEQGAENRSL